MANFSGTLGVSLKEVFCKEETNEIGNDEIMLYVVLIFREHGVINQTKVVVAKSSLIKNMFKGKHFTDFLGVRMCVDGPDFGVCFEAGNLLNLSVSTEVNSTIAARNRFLDPNLYIGFAFLTEHDDSNVNTILSKITSKVNAIVNSAPTIMSNAGLEPEVKKAISDGFKAGRSTSFFKNSDDSIQIVDMLTGLTQQQLDQIYHHQAVFNVDIPFTGDGGKYQLKFGFSGFSL